VVFLVCLAAQLYFRLFKGERAGEELGQPLAAE
jgi:hypothetical protein